MKILALLILSFSFVAPVYSQDEKTEYQYTLSFDCDHPDETNEWTGNSITVAFIHNDQFGKEKVYYTKTYKGISESQCTEPLGGVLGNNFTFSLNLPREDRDPYYLDKIRITTSGTDGFMIDALKFEKTRYYYKKILNNWVQSGTAWDDVQKWGVNKGGAWCLSGDATDADRTWKGTVSACYRYIEFDIKTGKSQGYH